jgi:cytochrome c biogenesis protein
VWVRAVRGNDGVTVVEMAGLGRSESAKLPEELGELAGVLFDQAPSPSEATEAEPDSVSDSGAASTEGAETT